MIVFALQPGLLQSRPNVVFERQNSDRKKRSFEKKAEEAVRKLSTVDQVVDFYALKDAYWNTKLIEI